MKTKMLFHRRSLVAYPDNVTKVFKADGEYMIPNEYVERLVKDGNASVVEEKPPPSRQRRGRTTTTSSLADDAGEQRRRRYARAQAEEKETETEKTEAS